MIIVPNKTIVVNGTNLPLGPSHRTRNKRVGAIIGGIIGGIAAVFAVIGIEIGIVIFVRRGNRPNDSMVTPFHPDLPEDHSAQNTGITIEQRPSVTEEPGEEVITLLCSSSPVTVLLISRSMGPPVGLSDKQLARLQLRLRALEDIPTSNPQDSTSSVPRYTSDCPGAGGAAIPNETRRLIHSSEIESLKERLHAGEIVFDASPSYDMGG